MINIFTIEIRTHLAQTRPDTMQTRHLVSKKVEKWLKRGLFRQGAILIIIAKGHCILCTFLVSFFTVFLDSVVFFASSRTSLQWGSHRLLAGYLQCRVKLMHCMVLSYCRWRGFEAIVMFGAILITSFFS